MPSRSSKRPAIAPLTIGLGVVAVLFLAVAVYYFAKSHPRRGIVGLVVAIAVGAGAVYTYVRKT
jgi:hypothetical protein